MQHAGYKQMQLTVIKRGPQSPEAHMPAFVLASVHGGRQMAKALQPCLLTAMSSITLSHPAASAAALQYAL